MKDNSGSLVVTCAKYVESPVVVGFTDRDYRNKSVATHIHNESELETIRSAGIEPQDLCVRGSDSTSGPGGQHILIN